MFTFDIALLTSFINSSYVILFVMYFSYIQSFLKNFLYNSLSLFNIFFKNFKSSLCSLYFLTISDDIFVSLEPLNNFFKNNVSYNSFIISKISILSKVIDSISSYLSSNSVPSKLISSLLSLSSKESNVVILNLFPIIILINSFTILFSKSPDSVSTFFISSLASFLDCCINASLNFLISNKLL